MASSLNNLGSVYEKERRYSEAEALYKRALAIWEKVLGPEHRQLAASLNNLAECYYRRGHYREAEALLQRSLSIGRRLLDRMIPAWPKL